MSRIEYRPPAGDQVLQRYNFDLPQNEFLAAGTYPIPISDAVFMMLLYTIPQFNFTWNTFNPNISLITDTFTITTLTLGFAGGTGNATFTKYPDFNIDAAIQGLLTLSWTGNAGLIAGDPLMNFSLFYVLRTF